MSETYGTLGATVPESDDYASGGADVPKAFREFTDSVGEGQGKGKLLVVQNTGAAAWKALKGDATLAEDGTLTIGAKKVMNGMLADDAVTAAKIAADGVGASEIAAGAVGESELADGAVTSQKAKLTGGIVAPSADLAISSAWQDVAGTTLKITPAVTSILKIWLAAHMDFSGDPGWEGAGAVTVNVDEARQSQQAIVKAESAHGNEFFGSSASQVYRVQLTATEHTIKLQGILLGALNLTMAKLEADNTRYVYELTAA